MGPMTSPFAPPPEEASVPLPPPTTGGPPPPPPTGPAPASPPPPPPGTTSSPPPPPGPERTPPPPPAAEPPTPPPPPPESVEPGADGQSAPEQEPDDAGARPVDDDLSDLLDRLHDDLELERAASVDDDQELTDPRDLERPTTESIVIESEGGLEFQPTFPSWAARVVTLLVDAVIVNIAVFPGFFMIAAGSGILALLGIVLVFFGFVAVNVSYAQSVARTGQWIGNRVTKTRVVDARTGRNLDVASAGARFAVRHVISPILLIGFIVAFGNSQRRTFHDRVATSVVIARPRETWSAGDGSA